MFSLSAGFERMLTACEQTSKILMHHSKFNARLGFLVCPSCASCWDLSWGARGIIVGFELHLKSDQTCCFDNFEALGGGVGAKLLNRFTGHLSWAVRCMVGRAGLRVFVKG